MSLNNRYACLDQTYMIFKFIDLTFNIFDFIFYFLKKQVMSKEIIILIVDRLLRITN